MNRLSLWWALIIAVVVACNIASSQARNKNSSNYQIVPEAVERVEILCYPERILTRVALTPERLERQYKYKVEIREFPASVQRERLVSALREASFSPSGGSYDVRTAVLLFDKSGKRMLSLYFDRSGKNGAVNREPVSTNDAVYRWARSMMRGFAD
jgi:hypothetical protein